MSTELDRKEGELRRLRDELALYRDLYDHAPVGYLTLEGTGRVVQANLTVANRLGIDRDRLVGLRLEDLVLSDDRPRLAEHLRRARDNAGRHTCELVLRHGDGSLVPVVLDSLADAVPGHCRVAVLEVNTGEQGQRPGTEAGELHAREPSADSLRDLLADRQRVESALHRERRLIDYLFQTAPLLVLVLDADGRVIRVSRHVERVTGYAPADLVGRDWFELMTPEDERAATRTRYADMIEEGRAGGSVTRVNTRPVVARDGALRQIEWHTSVVRDGDSALMLTIGLDLSARKRLEHEVQHAQKMEAIGRLASGVAHDFNNVLMGIMGCARVAADELTTGHPARVFLDEIGEAAKGGSAVVRQLLSFARKQDDSVRVVDINWVIARNGTMLRSLLGEDIQLAEVLSGTPAQILCNPVELEQAIMNLAANARDAMPRGGTLTIEVGLENLDHDQVTGLLPGRYVCLTVADTGCGMNSETLEYLFEPFYTTKPVEQGTGLGLSTVYATVAGLGGSINVDSEPDQGTTFRIYLPAFAGERAISRPSSERSSGLECWGTILVVEDDRLVRLAARHYLETAGYTVLEAADEARALELAAEHDGKLVALLCDVILASGSSRRVAAEVGRMHPEAEVIFMSAHPMELLIASGRLAPGATLLQKPFMQDELLEAVLEATLEEPTLRWASRDRHDQGV